VLPVPLGTVVFDADGVMIADLAQPGQRIVLVPGGRGGKGNAALLSRANVAPTFAEQGEYGEQREFVLELKLIADAALIDYPFTTLEPNLGVVEIDDRRFVLADIPGLIEGAADGKGLGHEFLRHAERARVLVILLDPSELQELDCIEQLAALRGELAAHDPQLALRAEVGLGHGDDLGTGADQAASRLQAAGVDVHVLSAATGSGVNPFLHAVADEVERAERDAPQGEGFMLHRPGPPGVAVSHDGERWVVSGRLAERAIALDDLTKPEAADFAAQRLASSGVDDALRAAGAQPGDEVQIGDIVFEFTDD
jgi:GTP-binding protein